MQNSWGKTRHYPLCTCRLQIQVHVSRLYNCSRSYINCRSEEEYNLLRDGPANLTMSVEANRGKS